MEPSQDRWRRPGVRLAIVALIGITIYFLVIFVQQSWNLYHLTREVQAKEAEVAALEREVAGLEQKLGWFLQEEGRRLLAEQYLLYLPPGTHMAVLVAPAGRDPTVITAPEGNPAEALAALPIWQQWWRVIFTPMNP